jgi:DNA repair exonuclease SbcCD nuclease subunit
MKIIHTSDIRLGRRFSGLNLAGDRLRAGLKTTFSKIIDFTLNQHADLLIISGNLFDNLDISNNLQSFVAREIERLEKIPAVILPGSNDRYTDGSFWKTWGRSPTLNNLHVLVDHKGPVVKLDNPDCEIHGLLFNPDNDSIEIPSGRQAGQKSSCKIAAFCGPVNTITAALKKSGQHYDYIALGGQTQFQDLASTGLKAAYSGSPEIQEFGAGHSGYMAVVDLDPGRAPIIKNEKIGGFIWKTEELAAKDILNNDDLTKKIRAQAGPDVLLKVKLSGLALFEASLEPNAVRRSLEGEFLYLDIVDDMKVLPENISEVKVSEKTILGQYIKVMAADLNRANNIEKARLEKSLKIGYALLQGREPW